MLCMDKLPPAVTAAMLQLSNAYRRETDARADAARHIAAAQQERRAAQAVVHAAITASADADAVPRDYEPTEGDYGDAVVWDQAGLPLAA